MALSDGSTTMLIGSLGSQAALHVYVHNEGGKKLYAANGWVERKTDATLPAMLMVSRLQARVFSYAHACDGRS